MNQLTAYEEALYAVGITGTREQITEYQQDNAIGTLRFLFWLGFRLLHHGDCIGVDAYMAEEGKKIGYTVVAHPPLNSKYRANNPASDIILPAKEYLERDDDIVYASKVGLALPNSARPKQGSGTWYTVSKMQEQSLPHFLITPSKMSLHV
jgi:hypothetical protein